MTERSDGGTDARIQAGKSYRGDLRWEPGEGGRDRGDVSRTKKGLRRDPACGRSSECIIISCADIFRDYARADNGLVPARSRGSKPTMLFEEI